MKLAIGMCWIFVAVVAVSFGCLEAYVRWRRSAAARGLEPLGEVDTFHESELTWDHFYSDYVLKRRPVKIIMADPSGFNVSKLLDQCGDNPVDLLSDATYDAMKVVQEDLWLTRAFDWIAMPLIGRWTTLDQELQRRVQVPLREYLAYAQETVPPHKSFSLPLPLLLLQLLPVRLALLLEVFARPMYLHDTALKSVCPAALDWFRIPGHLWPNWFFAHEEVGQKVSEDEPTFFVGKAHALSYPMHQNILEMDFAILVLQGAKRYALFDVSEHDKLGPIDVGEIWLYLVDAFAPDLLTVPRYREARGWSGVLRAGEMLWSPGDSIHSFENFDFERPTIALKYVYASHTMVCSQNSDAAACAETYGMPPPTDGQSTPTVAQYVKYGRAVRSKLR